MSLSRAVRRVTRRKVATQRFATAAVPAVTLVTVSAVDPGDGTPGSASATVTMSDGTEFDLPPVGGYLPALGSSVPLLMNGSDPISLLQGVMVDGDMQSRGFVPGVSGWRITADGDAEFNSATIRGTIEADTFTTAADPTVDGAIEITTADGANTLVFRRAGPLEDLPSRIAANADSLNLQGPDAVTGLTLGSLFAALDGDIVALDGNDQVQIVSDSGDVLVDALAGLVRLTGGSTEVVVSSAGVEVDGVNITSPVKFKAHRTTTQTPSSGSWQPLTPTVVDINDGFGVTGSQVTPTQPGWYRVTVNAAWEPVGALAVLGVAVARNGVLTLGPDMAASTTEHANGTVGAVYGVNRDFLMNGTTDYLQVFGLTSVAGREVTILDFDIQWVRF